jgi:hypothetical protein
VQVILAFGRSTRGCLLGIERLEPSSFFVVLALIAYARYTMMPSRSPYGPNQTELYSYANDAPTSILWLMRHWSKSLLVLAIGKYLDLHELYNGESLSML